MPIDAKLAANLKQAKTTPMHFVFVAKGNDGVVLVDKKKISPKDADEAKKACGGGTIYRGRCKGEEGTLVFEMGKEAPKTLSALTKKIIKQDAGLTLDVEYRFAADLAAEEKPETPGEGGAPAAPAPVAGEAPTAPEPPPAPPPPPPPPQPGQGAEVMKRLNSMAPEIKAALAGANKAQVQTLFLSVNGLIKNKDFVQAAKVLDELGPLVKGAPAAPAAPQTAAPSAPAPSAPAPSAPAPSAGDAAQAAEWERRMIALEPKVRVAQKTRASEAKWMTLFMSAQDAGSAEDFGKALTIVEKIEALLGAAPQGGSTPEIEKGIVEKRKFLLTRWKQIPAEIAPDLEALIAKVGVEHPEVANLPQLRAVLNKQLQALYDELQNEIDAAINKGDSKGLQGVRDRVLAHKFVNHMMANPFVPGSKFQSSILNALQEVEQRLAS